MLYVVRSGRLQTCRNQSIKKRIRCIFSTIRKKAQPYSIMKLSKHRTIEWDHNVSLNRITSVSQSYSIILLFNNIINYSIIKLSKHEYKTIMSYIDLRMNFPISSLTTTLLYQNKEERLYYKTTTQCSVSLVSIRTQIVFSYYKTIKPTKFVERSMGLRILVWKLLMMF